MQKTTLWVSQNRETRQHKTKHQKHGKTGAIPNTKHTKLLQPVPISGPYHRGGGPEGQRQAQARQDRTDNKTKQRTSPTWAIPPK